MANLYRIGEVSKVCEISIKTLRFYEEEGLIKPVKVDIYTGYRYYNDEDIEKIYKIKLLKNLGFSLKEIRDFDQKSLSQKIKEIEEELLKLKDNQKLISYLQKQKGEKIMKPFIKDEKVIGKWNYVCTAKTKENYLEGKTEVEKTPFCPNLYFLPEGKGYWVFERWTKGEIYHYSGTIFTYELTKDDTLILNIKYENGSEEFAVYTKENSKEYTEEEIQIKDEVNLPFVMDKKVLGYWEAVDFIDVNEKDMYKPRKCDIDLWLKSLTFNPNGEVVFENAKKELYKNNWTKGKVIKNNTVSDYIIKEINGETYLINDWKSGDYTYQGMVYGCYVFKKLKI